MADNARNIFISHIHEDDAGLDKLKTLLKDNGIIPRDYSITNDNPNNAHSEDYIKSSILAPRIRQSSTLVVYISPEIAVQQGRRASWRPCWQATWRSTSSGCCGSIDSWTAT